MQNPAELNGVKYLKSHASVLLVRAGAPTSTWFLAQHYLLMYVTYVLIVSSTGKYKNRYHGGDTRYFPNADVLLV